MKPAVLRLNCAASATVAAADPASRARPDPRGSAGGRRGLDAGKSGVAGSGERERGLREGATAPGPGCGRGREGRGAGGGERGARGEEAGPRTGAWPGTRFRARQPPPRSPAGARRRGGGGRPGLTPSAAESAPARLPALASCRLGLRGGRQRAPHQ